MTTRSAADADDVLLLFSATEKTSAEAERKYFICSSYTAVLLKHNINLPHPICAVVQKVVRMTKANVGMGYRENGVSRPASVTEDSDREKNIITPQKSVPLLNSSNTILSSATC